MDENSSAFHAPHRSEKDAALFSKTRVDQPLIVDSAEPAGVQSARKGHFQIVVRLPGETWGGGRVGAKFVQRLPVNARDVGHIFGGFETALDLQRGHSGADQIRQHFQAGQVLRSPRGTGWPSQIRS